MVQAWLPLAAGHGAAGLLVMVSAGVTEPFLTNGYADPLWSLAAVGAVAFGLQLRDEPSTRAAAVVLILVAGMTKNEGSPRRSHWSSSSPPGPSAGRPARATRPACP